MNFFNQPLDDVVPDDYLVLSPIIEAQALTAPPEMGDFSLAQLFSVGFQQERSFSVAPELQSDWTTTTAFCLPDTPLGECTAGLKLADDAASFAVPAPPPSAAMEGLCVDPRDLVRQASTDAFLTAAELTKLFQRTEVPEDPTGACDPRSLTTPATTPNDASCAPASVAQPSSSRRGAGKSASTTRRSARLTAHKPPPSPAPASAHECPTCSKAFSGAFALKRHRKTHQPSTIACGVCGRAPKGSRVFSLIRHQRGNAQCLAKQRLLTDEQLAEKGYIARAARAVTKK